MPLNSHNQFSNFIQDAPLTHSTNTPLLLQHIEPFKYQDDKFFNSGRKNVGAYAGERICWKQSGNYTSLATTNLPHSKLFFILTKDIIDNNDPSAKGANTNDVRTVLGLSFTGRDTLRYMPNNNPNVDKFC